MTDGAKKTSLEVRHPDQRNLSVSNGFGLQ
jgi:hypothetical protein